MSDFFTGLAQTCIFRNAGTFKSSFHSFNVSNIQCKSKEGTGNDKVRHNNVMP